MLIENNYYYLLNKGAPGLAVTYFGNPANDINIGLAPFNEDAAQKWNYRAGRFYVAANLLYCIDRYGATGEKYNNADLWVAAAGEDSNQKLTLVESTDGYRIKLQARELYLTANANLVGNATGKTTKSAGNVFWAEKTESCLQIWEPLETNMGIGNGLLVVGRRPSTLNYENGKAYSRFERGQCTYHAYGRAKEVTGREIEFAQEYGLHAKTWWGNVTNCAKTSVPTANSVAVWNDGGAYGHVAYVEKVEKGTIYFTEMNWDTPNGSIDAKDGIVKTATTSTFAKRGSYILSGYLVL